MCGEEEKPTMSSKKDKREISTNFAIESQHKALIEKLSRDKESLRRDLPDQIIKELKNSARNIANQIGRIDKEGIIENGKKINQQCVIVKFDSIRPYFSQENIQAIKSTLENTFAFILKYLKKSKILEIEFSYFLERILESIQIGMNNHVDLQKNLRIIFEINEGICKKIKKISQKAVEKAELLKQKDKQLNKLSNQVFELGKELQNQNNYIKQNLELKSQIKVIKELNSDKFNDLQRDVTEIKAHVLYLTKQKKQTMLTSINDKSRMEETAESVSETSKIRERQEIQLNEKEQKISNLNYQIKQLQIKVEVLEKQVGQKQEQCKILESQQFKSTVYQQNNKDKNLQLIKKLTQQKLKLYDQKIKESEKRVLAQNLTNKLTEQITELKSKHLSELQIIQTKLYEKEKHFDELQQQLQSKNEEFVQAKQSYQQTLKKIEGKNKVIQQNSIKNIRQITEKTNQMLKQLQKNKNQIIKLTHQNQMLNSSLNVKVSPQQSSELIQLKRENQELNSYKNQAQIKIEELKQKNKKIEELNTIVYQLKGQKERLAFDYQELTDKFNNLQETTSNQISVNNQQQLRQEIIKITDITDSLKVQLTQAHRKITQYQSQLTRLQYEGKTYAAKLKSQQEDMNDLKEVTMRLRQNLDKYEGPDSRLRTQSFVEHKAYFAGDILQNRKDQKKFLISTISNHMHKQFDCTKLLYNFQRDKGKNFNDFILGHSNLVLIVETKNARFAAYYSGELKKNQKMSEQALIISMNKRQFYTLNNVKNNQRRTQNQCKNIRGMTYDQFYIIFGNAEIRIRNSQNVVFSNFGVAGTYFENRKQKIDAIFCEGNKNTVEMINYEIYEVFFENERLIEYEQEHV